MGKNISPKADEKNIQFNYNPTIDEQIQAMKEIVEHLNDEESILAVKPNNYEDWAKCAGLRVIGVNILTTLRSVKRFSESIS